MPRLSRLLITALVAMSALSPPAMRPVRATEIVPPEVQAFAMLEARYLRDSLPLAPVWATQVGEHRFDGDIDDLSAGGRARSLAFAKQMLADLDRLNGTALFPEHRVDVAVLRNKLRADIWDAETLQSWAWDPQIYNSLAGNALYLLMARDFAPMVDRLRSATRRMEKLPALLAQARANLVPARVPRVHAETVAKQNGGLMQIVDQMMVPQADVLPPADRERFDAAVARLRAAVAAHQIWLDKTLVPNAKGDFRLGAAAYDGKLAFSLDSPLSRQEIKRRAQAALTETRAEMYEVARTALMAPRRGSLTLPPMPDAPTEAQRQAVIEAALAMTYADRPDRDGVIATAKAALVRATAFVREKDLVTLPDTPLKIIPMPAFQQGVAVAYCDPPGPLEQHLGTFYAVSPIPKEWTAEQATSFLSEYNDRMIDEVTVHEAVPGHYLQLAHANRNPSSLRALLYSTPFVEGWALYAEGMMVEAGYNGDDPLFKLTMLKMRLRAIANALLDIGVHAEGMSREQAMRLMTVSAFQQEREAAGKWTRAQLTSAQLPSYFVGYTEHRDLRAAMVRMLDHSFNLKRYHDKLLAHGSPPVRYARALMLGEKVE